MLIKEFAAKYKLTNDTVRYYEKEGLLNPIRQENGYRLYGSMCERAMEFIIVLKQLGFSLQEIKLLLSLENSPISNDCNEMSTAMFTNKISDLEKRVEFFSAAIQALQIARNLMEQGKYAENKHKIESLVEGMYQKIDEGNERDVTS
ncbi:MULTISPECIES: MerR family transcriptional regulator [unclassified Sporosarcina]|uniref:MerR family transcriptional regulator n=1 Tax=unclassified Sporosarcina TaxID=2647733 RepID=UPI00203AC5A2|nr:MULTISPECIES: MerR family transcriptional regulator [unclassified Sporosarcina]GKV66504.1 transcriptional regulator [Sporosarcina sp. NCCP-2331]GLB56781.1 transcriptional regulator [Sporosarcina sp. NCCP-2378]